jgi:alcohol dehydrogenase class IV
MTSFTLVVQIARSHDVDAVVGIGGGSSMDLALLRSDRLTASDKRALLGGTARRVLGIAP